MNPYILVASELVGVREVYRVGGAQAIAAMAYGTESIPRVDVSDVSVTGLTLSDMDITAGDQVTVSSTVTSSDDLDSIGIGFYVDDKEIETIITSLTAGVSTELEFRWVAVEGEHTLSIRADVFDQINESDENNNMAEWSGTILPYEGATLTMISPGSTAGASAEDEGTGTDIGTGEGSGDVGERSSGKNFHPARMAHHLFNDKLRCWRGLAKRIFPTSTSKNRDILSPCQLKKLFN